MNVSHTSHAGVALAGLLLDLESEKYKLYDVHSCENMLNYLYEEDVTMEIKKIYFDMDGVLADFERGINEICGMDMPIQGLSTDEEDNRMWEAVKEADHFYDNLEPMKGAIDMYRELSSKYDCEILSAIPKPHRGIATAGEDKRNWVCRVLSPSMNVNIVYSQDKKNYAKDKGTILIDDLDKNIKEWENCGGTGIKFESAEQVLKRIKDLEE